MADVKWIKLSTNIFDDEKIDFIQSLPEGDSLIVIWVRLLAMAGKCNQSGYIFLAENIVYTEEGLSYKFKKSVNIVKLALKTFQNLNMIEINKKGIKLINWSKYQSLDGLDKIKEKEQARLRKQKQRENAIQIEASCIDKTVEEMAMSRSSNCNITQDEIEKSHISHDDIIQEKIDMSRKCHGNVTQEKIETSRKSHINVTRDPSIIELDIELDKELDKDKDKELDKERELEGEDKGVTRLSYQQVVDNFNKICDLLPKVTILDEHRKNSINKSLNKFGDINIFTKVFKKAQASDFLSGRNEKWQGCSFDWLISEVNITKILEGNYDNRKVISKGSHDFNDYNQRVYDYDDLEKKLLGYN